MQRLRGYYPEFFSFFSTVVTGSDVKESKPDPEGYLTAARKAGADPRSCIVVEDSLQGMEAGKRAGALVVGLTTTVGRKCAEGKADVVIDSIDALDIERCAALMARRKDGMP